MESIANAQLGKFTHLTLTKRAGNASVAKIDIIDASTHRLEQGLSKPVLDAIAATLNKQEQVMVFLNRRGYAPAINCQECFWLADCKRCNKPYTLHQHPARLICHHCGSQKECLCNVPNVGQRTSTLWVKALSS